jgi:hypothetical protein
MTTKGTFLAKNSKVGNVRALAILALAGLLIVLERCHTYSEPLERDITTYAVIGEELLRGRVLYSNLWDHKPPAIHLTYALAEALAGEGPLAVFLLNVLTALATLAGIYQAGKILGGRAGGLWAAVIWAVVSGDLYLQANQPNEEAFLNVFQTWIFMLLLSASPKTLEPRRWVLIGILTAVASFYKPFTLLEAALTVVYFFLNWAPIYRSTVLRQFAVAYSCFVVSWAGLLGWFYLKGSLGDFWDAVFTYNLYYQGYHDFSIWDFIRDISGQALGFSTLGWLFLLFALGCGGAYLGGRNKEGKGPWLLWGTFLIAAELEILSTGRFFAHYDQLLLPPLILGAAGGIILLGERIGRKRWKCLPGAALLAFLIFHEASFYRLTAGEWADRKYSDGPVFAQATQLGYELDGMLKPGETFYEWGNETELYFAARRPPPSGIFYSYPLLNNPLAGELSQRVVGDLEKSKPEVFILNTGYYLSGDLFHRHPVLQFVLSHYKPLPQKADRTPFLLLVLKGGNLEKRLGASPPGKP